MKYLVRPYCYLLSSLPMYRQFLSMRMEEIIGNIKLCILVQTLPKKSGFLAIGIETNIYKKKTEQVLILN